MINHTFNLKEPNAKKDTLIFLRARFPEESKYLKYSTGEVINPKFWDNQNKSPISISGKTLQAIKNREIQLQLSRYEAEFYKIVSEFNMHDIDLTIDAVKERLDLAFKKSATKKTLFDVYQIFIDERKSLGKVSSSAIIKDERMLKMLKAFQKDTGYAITFKRMDNKFYLRFVRYCREEREVKLKNNTLGKYLVFIGTFLRWAQANKFHNYTEFQNWDKISSDTYDIALTEQEFHKMFEHDLSGNIKLEKVRDVFIFGCATGLRYSDYSKVNKSNVQSNHILINTQKGKEYITIPLNKFSKAILDKYECELPLISAQKFRDYIKLVAAEIEMNEKITKVSFIGAKRIEDKFTRSELVSTHTARRTFISLSLEKGMRPEVVMSITGHKDYKSFAKYIKLSQRIKSDEMDKAWS